MAHSTAIENEFGGFCELFKGENGYAYSDHLDRLGHHWALLNPPVGFKPYPCCASSHAAIDCALALRNTHAIDPSTIESVTIRAHPRRLQHTDDPTPSSGLAGKISVQYAVTRALIRGDVWIDDFTAEAFDSTIRGTVLEKIHVERAPELFETDRWGAHITLTTDTHDTYEHRVDGPRGSQINPLTPSELREKFTRCAANVLSEEAIHHALETLSEIPRQSDVRPTIESISPPQ